MKFFDLAPKYKLFQRFLPQAKALGSRAEQLKLPVLKSATSGCVLMADRRTGQTRVYFMDPLVSNRLYRDYEPLDALNFATFTPKDDAPPLEWKEKVQPVILSALAPSTSFSAYEDTGGDKSLPSHTPEYVLPLLKQYVATGNYYSIRYVLGVLWRTMIFLKTPIALNDVAKNSSLLTSGVYDCIVSNQDTLGRYYLAWGKWQLQPKLDGTIPPVDTNVPRKQEWRGFIIRNDDLEKAVFGVEYWVKSTEGGQTVFTDPYDAAVRYYMDESKDFKSAFSRDSTPGVLSFSVAGKLPDNSDDHKYKGPTIYGTFYSGSTLLYTGVSITRDEPGTFGLNSAQLNFSEHPIAWTGGLDRFVIADSLTLGDPSPLSMPYFVKRGVSSGEFNDGVLDFGIGSTWTFEPHAYVIDSTGALKKQDIALPDLIASDTDSFSSTGVGPQYTHAASGFSMGIYMFDGDNWLRAGTASYSGGASSKDEFGVATSSDGVGTATTGLPIGQAPSGRNLLSPTYESITPYGYIYDSDDYGLGKPRVISKEDAAAGTYSMTPYEDFVASTPTSTMQSQFYNGIFWGTYSVSSSSTSMQEHGFVVASAGGTTTGRRSQPLHGVYWYRSDQPAGVCHFMVLDPDILAWRARCNKYRSIYYGDIKPDSLDYEDPDAMLTELWGDVRIDINNFVTPAMLPWLSDESFLVIV